MTSINNRKGKIAKYTTALIELGFNEIPSKISPFKISSKARVVPQPGQGICHNNFEGQTVTPIRPSKNMASNNHTRTVTYKPTEIK